MRFIRLLKEDMRFQWKSGFYFIYLFLLALYIIILGVLSPEVKTKIGAILIFSDPATLGFFFMGAVILLEKSQNVLSHIAVSPLPASRYILSKTLSLSIISTIVAMVIAIAAGFPNLMGVFFGILFSSVIFTLIGVVFATFTPSLNMYLVVMIAVELVCFVPADLYLFVELPRLLDFFPLVSCMKLIAGTSTELWLDLLLIAVTIIVLYLLSLNRVKRMLRSLGGEEQK